MNDTTITSELLEAKSGNEAVIAAIIARHMNRIRFLARRAVSPGLDFDDAVQEGIIGLFFAIRSFKDGKGATFETYASTCVRNAIISAHRSAGRKKHSPLNQSVPISDNQSIPGPEEASIASEKLSLALQKAHTHLSGFEYEVLSLSLQGYSSNEIALKLERTPKAINNALLRLRHKLKQ